MLTWLLNYTVRWSPFTLRNCLVFLVRYVTTGDSGAWGYSSCTVELQLKSMTRLRMCLPIATLLVWLLVSISLLSIHLQRYSRVWIGKWGRNHGPVYTSYPETTHFYWYSIRVWDHSLHVCSVTCTRCHSILTTWVVLLSVKYWYRELSRVDRRARCPERPIDHKYLWVRRL